ncbi:MAG: tripartite tricarboxylate transporter substrate-binding protein [Burkholderiaceae bacterium]
MLGFAAGGGTDVIARHLAQKTQERLGANLYVDNKPGANGNIAAETVIKSPNDGYTLLYNTSSLVLNTALGQRLPFHFQRDLVPVALTANSPLVLVASPSADVADYDQFIRKARTAPGKLTFGSAGEGNITHLAALIFAREAGVKGVHVPYKSESFALTDAAGGHIDYYVGTAPGVVPFVKERKLVALAVASVNRLSSLPRVPTFGEVGLKTRELGSWSGIMAPAGTATVVIDKLNEAVRLALADKELIAAFAAQNSEPKGGSPDDYRRFLSAELQKWGDVVRAENIKVD